jgi:ribosomal protein S21
MKKKMKKEGLFQELKDRQYYQKPSFKRRETKKRRYINIKKAEKIRRNFL